MFTVTDHVIIFNEWTDVTTILQHRMLTTCVACDDESWLTMLVTVPNPITIIGYSSQ